MKRILLILLFLPIIAFSQSSLFTVNLASSIVATEDPNKTIGLVLNSIMHDNILRDSPDSLILDLPFFGSNIILKMQKYQPYSDNILTRLKTDEGDIDTTMTPQLLSYRLIYNKKSIGILNFVNKKINATLLINNKQFEISEYKGKYVIFDINNSINKSNFTCHVNQQINSSPNTMVNMQVVTPVCIELAIDIDNYTRNSFSSNQETLDWALAIISGVSQLYQAQTNAEIRVIHNTIWNVTDPYNSFSSTSDVLDELRDYWINNNSSINRDLVHFLSKRSLGGGIAYVDVLCSNNLGYAVSASLNSDTNFVFPNPTYTWNLGVVTHELGHNIGANHTHWCGWAADATVNPPFLGGPIDNCVDVEGNCTNNPSPQFGTIMSYCHIGGNGVILEFDDIVVNQALNPGISNASCVSTCVVSWDCDGQGNCSDPGTGNGQYLSQSLCQQNCVAPILGCTNPNASNFDPNANTSISFGGPVDNSFGNGSYFNGDQHLNFDSYKQCIIKSAMIYAEAANTITFELRNNSGNVIDDTTLSVVAGPQRINLNFDVPIANDMQLGVSSGALQNDGLYRNNSGPSYPYNIASAIDITSSSASSAPLGYYYFYYDIEVEITCLNIIIPNSWDCDGQGNCSDPGNGNGLYSSLSSCLSSCITPSWDCDGQGNCSDPGTGNGQYSSLTTCQASCITPSWDCDGQGNCSDPGTGNGQYTSLTSCQASCITPSWDCDGQGNCTDPGSGNGLYSSLISCETECSYVSVYEIGLSNFKIYPNPSISVFNVSFNSDTKQYINIRLVNLVGEIIFTEKLENFVGEYTHSFNLLEYSKGIYLIELNTDYGIVNKKLILQ